MSAEYINLAIRFSRRVNESGVYEVEADLDDGTHFERGTIELNFEDLLLKDLDSEAYGLELFHALFQGPVLRAYEQALGNARSHTRGRLRVRLRIDPEVSELHNIPWERLYHRPAGQDLPLAASDITPFSRYIALEMPEREAVEAKPLRVLIAIANPANLPKGLHPVDVEAETGMLARALGDMCRKGDVQVTLMPGRTGLSPGRRSELEGLGFQIVDGITDLDGIITHLSNHHVLHIISHGKFKGDDEDASYLLLENVDKKKGETFAAVKDEDLSRKLENTASLQLVYLTACETVGNTAGARNPLVGLGPKLVQAGIPAVVAMRGLLPMDLAQDLTASFYSRLLEHGVVDLALNQARNVVWTEDNTNWAIPVLFMRLKQGQLFTPPPDLTLPLTSAERVYLSTLRDECDRLPLIEDVRESPTRKRQRASLSNVYVDLETTTGPDFERVCERLQIPETERKVLRELLTRVQPESLKTELESGRPDEITILHALAGEGRGLGGRQEGWREVLKDWIKDEGALRQALKPVTALEALSVQPHLVLLGNPGSGKSTLVNHLAYVLAGALSDQEPDWADILENRFRRPLFPLRIVARRWSGFLTRGEEVGVERVYEALAALPGDMDPGELLARLDQPDTLVMFDGLDEAPVAEEDGDYDRRSVLIDSVLAFRKAHPGCRVVVTSRIKPYQTPGYRLPEWPDLTLARLDDPRIQRFVARWYEEIARIEGLDEDEAELLGSRLVDAIGTRGDLHEMAEIPLLLTMLTLVNKRYGLPENRAELYDQCTEQLLWEWEKTKAEEGKTQSLDHLLVEIEPRRTRQDIEQILWELTFEAHRLSGKRTADLQVDDLRKALAESPPRRPENWAWAERLIRFMQARGGLLVAQDDDTFTFPHRSFQEYLAARQLLELDDAAEEAVILSSDDAWREVILLACGFLGLKGPSSMWRMLVDELAFAIEDEPERWQASILAGIALREYGPEKVGGRIGRRLRSDLPPILTSLMQDPNLPPAQRLEAGLLAADLGLLPDDLDELIPISPDWLGYRWRIGKYPVTNAQYERFMAAGAYDQKKPWWTQRAIKEITSWEDGKWPDTPRLWRHNRYNRSTQPVVTVSWYEAMAYCQWLTEIWRAEGVIGQNESVRLPIEAEWRVVTGESQYTWGDEFNSAHCNSRESEFDQTSPVHMYPTGATLEGVRDLCGNVWEWMYNEYRQGSLGNAIRGGAFSSNASGVTSSARYGRSPYYWARYRGFRVVVVPSSRV